jgi:hypothetical protein
VIVKDFKSNQFIVIMAKTTIVEDNMCISTSAEIVTHGDDMTGTDVVAIWQGHLHSPGKCEWCDCLRMRVMSRTLH